VAGSVDVPPHTAPHFIVRVADVADLVTMTALAHESEVAPKGRGEVPGWRDDLGQSAIDEPNLASSDRAGKTSLEVVGSVVMREYRCRAPGGRDVIPPGIHQDTREAVSKLKIIEMIVVNRERTVASKSRAQAPWLELLVVWSRIPRRFARPVDAVDRFSGHTAGGDE
jgi:hypothetical protein